MSDFMLGGLLGLIMGVLMAPAYALATAGYHSRKIMRVGSLEQRDYERSKRREEV